MEREKKHRRSSSLYIKKIREIPPITIWEVRGEYVRDNMDAEFTNFGHHYVFPFIPTYEFWIDEEHAPGEEKFFIDHLLKEYYLMKNGTHYLPALAQAERVERRERHKSKLFKRVGRQKPLSENLVKRIHKYPIRSYGTTPTVWVVNGELVRDKLFIEFTEGGHEFVYPSFVPKGEIWLDDDLSIRDRRFVLLHELHERAQMALKKYSYDKAHQGATIVECFARHNPKFLDKKLEEALLLNKKVKH